MADYNVILQAEDRKHGNPVHAAETKDFSDFMISAKMQELRAIGGTHTWANGHTCNRIDRAIVNVDWMMQMPVMEVHMLRPNVSYHSPFNLRLDRTCNTKAKNFRFFNCIVEHSRFLQVVEQAWKRSNKGDMKTI